MTWSAGTSRGMLQGMWMTTMRSPMRSQSLTPDLESSQCSWTSNLSTIIGYLCSSPLLSTNISSLPSTQLVLSGSQEIPLRNQGADDQRMSGYELGCWRIYYGCTVCRAYTNLPWKQKLALTNGDMVNSSWELYLV